MIQSKDDYYRYIKADKISRGVPLKRSIKQMVKSLFVPDHIGNFQCLLRKVEYYKNCRKDIAGRIILFFKLLKFKNLSLKLNFNIPPNVCGPGLSIAHYGTININNSTKIGENCRLHTCVNIGTEAGYSGNAPIIGDNCYIGPGVKIYGNITIPQGVAIGANAVVNKSFSEQGIAIAGVPAKKISDVNTFEILIPGTKLVNIKDDISNLSSKEIFNKFLIDNNFSSI